MRDSKSRGGNTVRVRPPPPAPAQCLCARPRRRSQARSSSSEKKVVHRLRHSLFAGTITVKTVPVRPTTPSLAGSLTFIRKESCTSLTAQLVCRHNNCKNSACAPDHAVARRLAHFHQKRKLYIAYGTFINSVQLNSNDQSWARSSVGRALRSQRRGRGFDPLRVHYSNKA